MTWGRLAVAGWALMAPASRPSADCSPPGRAIVAEVFYDAAGDDTGLEFVELFNPTAADCALEGVRLEVGDGSGAGRWTLRWIGRPGDRVAAGARFVIGGSAVPSANAVAALDLQNGPDAVRVLWPDGASEVVGYGSHEFAEYACGAPAPDSPSGFSLARVPDDAQRGSNADDFRVEAPSPGRANQVARDAALLAGSLAVDPARPEAGAIIRARAAVLSRGAVALEAGTIATSFWLDESLLGTHTIPQAVASTDTVWIEVAGSTGAAGKRMLSVIIAAIGDGAPGNDRDSMRVRVGPGPLEPVEIQFHPDHGEGEWVEIRNATLEPVDVSGFRLADRTAAGATIGTGAWLEPESLAVLVQDRAAFLARFPALDTSRVWEARPWAALNNSDAADGFADVVRLIERDGTPCSDAPYSAAGVPAGVPIERRSEGGWQAALEAEGTPLRPPRSPPPMSSEFELQPARVTFGAPIRLEWSLPWPRATLAIRVFDLEGALVAHAASALESGPRGAIAWTPSGLGPGVYVVSMVARSPDGASVSAARVLRVGSP
jgi:hypothetical protein